MCSWCWAFKPIWQKILTSLPQNLTVEYLLGGLAPDNDNPMSPETRKFIMDNWRRVQDTVPATEFNYEFWRLNTPKRSTFIACRAVISAKIQNPKFERAMIDEIQYAGKRTKYVSIKLKGDSLDYSVSLTRRKKHFD